MAINDIISEYVIGTKWERLDREIIDLAKMGMLDWLGVSIGGRGYQGVKILKNYILECGGNQEATCIGQNLRTSVPWAALVNGTAAHILDFDDTYEDTIIHATTPVLSAAVALGEKLHVSGKEIIEAYICGYEISTRLGRIIIPSHFARGYHPTGTLGSIGAAVACCKILKLTRVQIGHAIGAAATQAAGIREVFGTMCKSFHAGKAAMNGVLAASLASQGFTSSDIALEGKNGFFNVASDQKRDAQVFSHDLSNTFQIKNNVFKAYPSCLLTHASIECMLNLRNKYKILSENVKRINAYVFRFAPDAAGIENPRTELEAKFSLKHCIATALVRGAVRQTDLPGDIDNSEIMEARNKIHIEIAPEMVMTKARMVVEMKNGEIYEIFIECPKGSPACPMSQADLNDKFFDLVKTSHIRPQDVINCVSTIENLDDISTIMLMVQNE